MCDVEVNLRVPNKIQLSVVWVVNTTLSRQR